MKIAVVHNLPPGGQKRALHEQVKRLSKYHTIDLYTLSHTNENFLPLKKYVRTHTIAECVIPKKFPSNIFSIYTELPLAYRILAERIGCHDYDIAYVHPCFHTQSPYILNSLCIPSIYSCPEVKREFYEGIPRRQKLLSYFMTFPFRYPLKNIDRNNARAATKIVTLSSYSKKTIQRIYKKEAVVNYLGVDHKFFRPLKIKKENMVLSIGPLNLLKGHDFVIKSLSMLSTSIRPKLVIAGYEATDTKYLIYLAEKLSVNLEVKINISDSQLLALYNKAIMLLYAPHNEPFGLPILEAFSVGLPVVGVNEGGIPEIITDERLGYLCKRDELRFSDCIKNLLDGNKNKRLAYYRRNYVIRNWSWDRSVDNLVKIMKQTIRERK